MKKLHPSRQIILGTLLLIILAGCAQAQAESPPPSTALTLTDALDREVTLPAPPERIVIAGRANFMLNDAVYVFPEAPERVVGLTKSKQSQGFIQIIDPDAEAKLTLWADASADEIVALDPDVVLLKSYMAKKIGADLEKLDIPTLYLGLETAEQYLKDIEMLGQLFDNEERGTTVINFYEERMTRIENEVTTLPAEEKPRALVLQYDTRSEEAAFKVPPAEWLQTWMVEFAGGTPIWKGENGGGWTVVGLEQIAAWEPEKIFLISYFVEGDEALTTLSEQPLWASLPVVQAGEVYAFPNDFYSWDQPDSRWILGLTWMAKRMHPERFATFSLTDEVQNFYATLYGMSETQIEDNVLPRLKMRTP
jgi:iron complex transport system substrate-binding protein